MQSVKAKKMTSENDGDIAAKDSQGNFLISKLYHQGISKNSLNLLFWRRVKG